MAHANSETSERRMTAAERRIEALKLRKAGMSFEIIGRALGITAQGAHKAVKKALEGLKQVEMSEADEVRRLELIRLDDMFIQAYQKAVQGDLGAMEKAIKIMDRRAKYLGLDAPTKVAPTDPSGENPVGLPGVIIVPPQCESAEKWLDTIQEPQEGEADNNSDGK